MRRFATILGYIALVLTLWARGGLDAQVYFYHTDPAGTPIAMSDANGNVMWRADYRPFGEIQQETGSAENNKLFVGKEKDDETGLYYFGARYMDDRIGRFISPDPVGPVDPRTGKINRMVLLNPQRQNYYAYALNNPYSYIDANGEAAASILRLGIQIGIKVSPRTASTIIGALGGGMIGQTLSDALLKEKSQGSEEGQNAERPQSEGQPGNEGEAPPVSPESPSPTGTIYVDPQGNAIPVPPGGRLDRSPDGKWVEVKDARGNPTGVRIDAGHKPKGPNDPHNDPRAQAPHGHVPGVKNPDGTPWLPVR